MNDRPTTGLILSRVSGVILFLVFSVFSINAQTFTPSPTPQDHKQPADTIDTVRVDTDLVDVNVTVFSQDPQLVVGKLGQNDFTVFEDGVAQEISLFTSAEAPFDLVLLIDLSASTKRKLKLIQKSAASFVDATRSTDRVAILTFTDVFSVVSPFTFDRDDLKKRIKEIEKPHGGTNFWDALRFVVATMLHPDRTSRRSAVVVMTDGVDNALPDVPGEGSKTRFEDLLGMVSGSDSVLVPIYLDTELEMIEDRRFYYPVAYDMARRQLGMLATASGSKVYFARKIEDLKDIYQQVIRDLSTVYSIGYRPLNKSRDGLWRAVRVQLSGWPRLAVRSRQGYFAK